MDFQAFDVSIFAGVARGGKVWLLSWRFLPGNTLASRKIHDTSQKDGQVLWLCDDQLSSNRPFGSI